MSDKTRYEITVVVTVEVEGGIRTANQLADKILNTIVCAPEYFQELQGVEVAEVCFAEDYYFEDEHE